MAMNVQIFSLISLLATTCLLPEKANAQIEIPEPGNETFRALDRLIKAAPPNQPSSNSGTNNQLSRMLPEQIWKMAEEGLLLHDGFPTFRQFSTLKALTEVIDHHPKKSQFVSLMLSKIATTSFPRREPSGWNEIAIIGDGGFAGLLISSVTKVAEPADYQRIVEAVLATNDAAKIAKLREAASLVSGKDEFERLLKLYGPGAVGTGLDPTKKNTSAPPSSSLDFSKSTNSTLPINEQAPKKAPEAKPTTSTLSEEPASLTQRSIIVLLIVATCGLLWLLSKRRS